MEYPPLSLSILPYRLAVCRLEKDAPIPLWAIEDTFFSITRTMDELSIVCSEANVPGDVRSEKEWSALKVNGPLDFALTGILASLAGPLASAGISIFAISTFDTDYILVKSRDLAETVAVLESFCDIQPRDYSGRTQPPILS